MLSSSADTVCAWKGRVTTRYCGINNDVIGLVMQVFDFEIRQFVGVFASLPHAIRERSGSVHAI